MIRAARLSLYVSLMALLYAPLAYAQTPSPALSPEEALLRANAVTTPAAEAPKVEDKPAQAAPAAAAAPAKPVEKKTPWLTQLGNDKFKPQETSIFFRTEDADMVDRILTALRGGGDANLLNEFLPADDPVQELIKEAEVKPKRASPIFFLSSLVYENNQKWSAWVSGKKLGPEQKMIGEEIEVVDVGPYSLTLAWKPEELNEITTRINTLTPVENDPTLSRGGSSLSIGEDGRVLIRLRSNQSFYAHDLMIREGLPFRDSNIANRFYWPPPMVEVPKTDVPTTANAAAMGGLPVAIGGGAMPPGTVVPGSNLPGMTPELAAQAAQAAGQNAQIQQLMQANPQLQPKSQ